MYVNQTFCPSYSNSNTVRKKNFYQLSSFSDISEQEIAMKDNAKLVSIHKESNFTKKKLMKQEAVISQQ